MGFRARRRFENRVDGCRESKREIRFPDTFGIGLLTCTYSTEAQPSDGSRSFWTSNSWQVRNATVQVWTVGEGFGIGSEFSQTCCAVNNSRCHDLTSPLNLLPLPDPT